MRWCRPVRSVAMQNIRKWKSDYRVWIALLLAAIIVHSLTKGLGEFVEQTGVKSSPWIFPFLYMRYYNKLLLFFPLILIFCNAPFFDQNQLYVLARAGKRKWCTGQLLYIFTTSALYFAYIFLLSIILNLRYITFTSEWGKVMNTLAKTRASLNYGIEFSAEENVIRLFSPMSAVWFTFLFSWVSGVILGLITFFLNMRIRGTGSFAASCLLVFSAVAAKDTKFLPFSPISWSTLNSLHLSERDRKPAYGYVCSVYTVIAVALFLIILLTVKKHNFDQEMKE